MSWCGTNVQAFWALYLIPMKRTTTQKDRFHVLFCPDQQWHRYADLNPNPEFDPQLVIGYFYLPFRDPNFVMNAGWKYDYNFAGLQGWLEKQKFGGDLAKAPIAMDMEQAMGSPPRRGPAGTCTGSISAPRSPIPATSNGQGNLLAGTSCSRMGT